jgi:hypothetical protein
MRRVCALAFFALAVLAVPAPALAWWDFLEELSGPGHFWGLDLQFRVFCLTRDEQTKERKLEPNSGVVIVLGTCKLPDNKVRRAAIDVGTMVAWTGHDPEFAGGDRIWLTTFGSAFSYNVFNANPSRDFLDVAAGGGGYVFASKGMPESFAGYYLEPVRFEIHPTTSFNRRTKDDLLPKFIPVLRFGWLLFPSGFDTTKFVDTTPKKIGADWVFNAGVFFNFQFGK